MGKKWTPIVGSVLGLIGLASVFLIGRAITHAAGPTCTPTGFVRDNINLTAAVVNPTVVGGKVNATGCNIGVYFGAGKSGLVNHAEIYGANYYGVVNNGGTVYIQTSKIHDIGEAPLNGTQHGVGIYFAYGSQSRGAILSNTLWNYQKGGIVVNGSNGTITIAQNQVLGQGPVNYIAQNGIQVGYGATADIESNTVTGNSYTGAGQASSGGIILVGGDCYGGGVVAHTVVARNFVYGNDIGVWFTNLDASCNPVATATNDTATGNTSIDIAVTNTTGAGTAAYQAGIVDQGDYDTVSSNFICGAGYTPPATPPPYLLFIDVTATNNVNLTNNTICGSSSNANPANPHTRATAFKASSVK